MAPPTNMMTIDVEDWFHILETDDSPQRDRWDDLDTRVERNTDRLLELLDEGGAHATFFTVGWVAWKYPELIKRIAAAGHELASHSFWHEVVRRHDRETMRADLEGSRHLLQDLSGQPVEGYRAPGNSITPEDAWAFDLLLQAGFSYDASLCPASSSHGGFPSPYKGPHLLRCNEGELVEIPSSTFGVGPIRIPYAGGGYVRLFPWSLLRFAIGTDNSRGRPTNIYLHPREIDVEQPRMELSKLRAFKYYVGLASTEDKLRKMMKQYRFIGARRWIAEHRPQLIGQVLDVREMSRESAPSPDPNYLPPLPPLEAGAAVGG